MTSFSKVLNFWNVRFKEKDGLDFVSVSLIVLLQLTNWCIIEPQFVHVLVETVRNGNFVRSRVQVAFDVRTQCIHRSGDVTFDVFERRHFFHRLIRSETEMKTKARNNFVENC